MYVYIYKMRERERSKYVYIILRSLFAQRCVIFLIHYYAEIVHKYIITIERELHTTNICTKLYIHISL